MRWSMLAIVALIGVVSCQAEDATKLTPPKLYDVIDRLIATPPTDEGVVETATGARLALASSGVFNDYTARAVMAGPTEISLIDYRRPSGVGKAERGPMLALTLKGGCVGREELLSRYSGLTISHVPSGRSQNEQTYYARQESWGTLSFGFPEHSPDCLETVVFSVRLHGEPQSFRR